MALPASGVFRPLALADDGDACDATLVASSPLVLPNPSSALPADKHDGQGESIVAYEVPKIEMTFQTRLILKTLARSRSYAELRQFSLVSQMGEVDLATVSALAKHGVVVVFGG